MQPVAFKEAQYLLSKPQGLKEQLCEELPIYFGKDQCVSCWKVSFTERLSILVHGKVWLGVYSTTMAQPPVWIEGARTVFESKVRRMPLIKRLRLRLLAAARRMNIGNTKEKTSKTKSRTK